MKRAPSYVAVITGTALLAGCSSGSSGDALEGATVGTAPATTTEETTQPVETPSDEPEPAEETVAAEPGADADPDQQADTFTGLGNPASYDGRLRDGVWQVGDAGEVEFAVVDGALELVDVRPADGWQVTDQDVAPDEIEIDFQQGPVEYEIEIEIEGGGILEIEIDQDIDPAEPGVYRVGDAATVEVISDGTTVSLGEVVVSDGWTETSRDVSSDELELDFRRDLETWEIDVDLDDGILEVEIDYEIEGTFPG